MALRVIFLITSASFFSAASVPCWANLGDTLDQSIARYGQPISHGKGDSTNGGYPWYAFKNGSFEIEEDFNGGIAVMETCWKIDRLPISESEQEKILQANAGSGKWGKPEGSRLWKRNDGAFAVYSPLTGNETLGNEMTLGLGAAQKR